MSYSRRNVKEFKVVEIVSFKEKAIYWSMAHEYAAVFENNQVPYLYGAFENQIAAGASKVFSYSGDDVFEQLKTFRQENIDYSFGYFSYDLKNRIEDLRSDNLDFQEAEEIVFFIPQHLIKIKKESIIVASFADPDEVFKEIDEYEVDVKPRPEGINITPGSSKEAYIEALQAIKEHLLEGDIYELNYCIEYTGRYPGLDPVATFSDLIEISPMPFSCLFKAREHYIICASPERFIKKENLKLISQPIKGTVRRGKDDEEDEILKNILRTSEKELAENMMIVDLVRNDLAKSSIPGSVVVEEMFGIYTFEQLHQMISTVVSQKREEIDGVEIIKNAFPMGSMTGAPKISAMKLIEKYEQAKRGLFSGACGYFTPDGDFDFNVLIRSIFYNQSTGNISFQVGSAITFDADAEYEYEECALKARAMIEVLTRLNKSK